MAKNFSALLLLSTVLQACSKELPQVYHGQRAGNSGPTGQTSMDVAQLNRHIFQGNVLQPMGGGVEKWVVLFCPKWFQPCQKLEPLFYDFARTWQQKQNMDSSFIHLRFAQVDCAVDKTLCNQQRVTRYPFVAIYGAGQQLHTAGINWKQDMSTQMQQFLEKLAFPASEGVSSESILPKLLEDFCL